MKKEEEGKESFEISLSSSSFLFLVVTSSSKSPVAFSFVIHVDFLLCIVAEVFF
jgi:hypothetical protein